MISHILKLKLLHQGISNSKLVYNLSFLGNRGGSLNVGLVTLQPPNAAARQINFY